MTSADVLLADAERICGGQTAIARASSHRIAALLARQALEMTLADRFTQRLDAAPPVQARAVLACLLGDDDAEADTANYCWQTLSTMCHQQQFELAPTASEVLTLVGKVRLLAASDPHARG